MSRKPYTLFNIYAYGTRYAKTNSVITFTNQQLYSNIIGFSLSYSGYINISSIPNIQLFAIPVLNIFNQASKYLSNLYPYSNSYMFIPKIYINSTSTKKKVLFGYANTDLLLYNLLNGYNRLEDYFDIFLTGYIYEQFYDKLELHTDTIIINLNTDNMMPSEMYNTIAGEVLLSKYNPIILLEFDYPENAYLSIYTEGVIYPNFNNIVNIEKYNKWYSIVSSL